MKRDFYSNSQSPSTDNDMLPILSSILSFLRKWLSMTKYMTLCMLGVFAMPSIMGDGGANPAKSSLYRLTVDDNPTNNYLIDWVGEHYGPSLGSAVSAGSWQSTGAGSQSFGDTYLENKDGAVSDFVTFTPDIPRASVADVFISYQSDWDRSDSVLIRVNHVGGTTIFEIDQTEFIGEDFLELGSFYFPKGSNDSSVDVVANGAVGVTVADAVRFSESTDLSGLNVNLDPRIQFSSATGEQAATIVAGESLVLNIACSDFSAESNYRIFVNGEYWQLVSQSDGAFILSGLPGGTHYIHATLSAPYKLTSETVAVVVEAGDFSDPTDLDNDSLYDTWEYFYAGDLSLTRTGDPDGDGLNNEIEFVWLSNPFLTDSDGDKISDAEEVANGTNPAFGGSVDFDNLPDDWEIKYFGNLEAGGDADADLDFLTNYEELMMGMDPTEPYVWQDVEITPEESVQYGTFELVLNNPNPMGSMVYTLDASIPMLAHMNEGYTDTVSINIDDLGRHAVKARLFWRGIPVTGIVSKEYACNHIIGLSGPSYNVYLGWDIYEEEFASLHVIMTDDPGEVDRLVSHYGKGWLVQGTPYGFTPDYSEDPSKVYYGSYIVEANSPDSSGAIWSGSRGIVWSLDPDLFDESWGEMGLGWLSGWAGTGSVGVFSLNLPAQLSSQPIHRKQRIVSFESPGGYSGTDTYQLLSYNIHNFPDSDGAVYVDEGILTSPLSYYKPGVIDASSLPVDSYELDDDGDGLSNGLEYDIGTNPALVDTDNDGLPDPFEVAYDSVLDPVAFNVSGYQAGDSPGSDPLTLTQEYMYGLSAENLSVNEDDDGLTNLQEIQIYGTIPTDSDTDNDGMSDGDEVYSNCTNPFYADADLDYDGDMLANGWEVLNGLAPCSADSDSDGMPDGWEVYYSFDPLDALNATSDTDPNDNADADFDEDGLSNVMEFAYGSDPTNKNSDIDLMLSELAPKTIGPASNPITVPLPGQGQPVVDDNGYPYLDPRTENEAYPLGYLPYRAPGDYSNFPLEFGENGLPVPDPAKNPGFYFFDSSTTDGYATTDQYPDTYFDNRKLSDRLDDVDNAYATYPESRRSIVEEVELVIAGKVELDHSDQPIIVKRFINVPWIGKMVWDESSYELVDDHTGMLDSYEVSRALNPSSFSDSAWESLQRNFLLSSEEYLIFGLLADDSEPDGMADYLEENYYADVLIGTIDSDGDEMPDGYELVHGLDPSSDIDGGLLVDGNELRDPDGDGLSNLFEMQAGLLPNYNDSDGDGLLDGWETEYETLANFSGQLNPRELIENIALWWDFDSNHQVRAYDRAPFFGANNTQDFHPFNDALIHGSAEFAEGGVNELHPAVLSLRDDEISMDSHGYLATPGSPDLRLLEDGFSLTLWYRWFEDDLSHFSHPSGLLQIGEERSILFKDGDYKMTLFPETGLATFTLQAVSGPISLSVSGVSSNEWHHLAVVYDGATRMLSMQRVSPVGFESDGVSLPPVVSSEVQLPSGVVFIDLGYPLYLGSLRGVPTKFVNSDYDDFRIYQSTLSAEDLAKLAYPQHPAWDNSKDRDYDGVTEYAEQKWELSSDKADTDGDGLADGLEVYGFVIDGGVPVAAPDNPNAYKTDPRLQDSDGDHTEGDEGTVNDMRDLQEALGRTIVITVTNREGDPALAFTETRYVTTNPFHRDTDLDGISDQDELLLGTDPTDADTDDDTLPDGWELANNPEAFEGEYPPFDPLDHSGEEDFDGDGRNNQNEYLDRELGFYVTIHEENLQNEIDQELPKFIDSDGDGLSDERELQVGTNKDKKDSDNDGVDDAEEIRYGYDPNDPEDPEPSRDSDHDGEGDQDEIAQGTNPYDPTNESIFISDRNILTPIVCDDNEIVQVLGFVPNRDYYKTVAYVHFPSKTPNPAFGQDPEAEEYTILAEAPWDVYLTGGSETEGLFANAGAVVLSGYQRTDIAEFEGDNDPRFEVKIDGANSLPYVEWVFNGNQSDWKKFFDYNITDPFEIHSEDNPFYHSPINLRHFLNNLARIEIAGEEYVQVELTYYANEVCALGGSLGFKPPLGGDNITFDEEIYNSGGDTVPQEGEFTPEKRTPGGVAGAGGGGGGLPVDEEEFVNPNILAYTESAMLPIRETLFLNCDDRDEDNVPNYADGLVGIFDNHGMRSSPGNEFAESDKFYELTLVLPENVDVNGQVMLRVTYDSSDPNDLTALSLPEGGYEYHLPDKGALRLWKKDADELRDVRSIDNASGEGDFIPSGSYIDISFFGFSLNPESGHREARLYLEAVDAKGLEIPELVFFAYADERDGVITEQTSPVAKEFRGFLTIGSELIPDYDRDGEIRLYDAIVDGVSRESDYVRARSSYATVEDDRSRYYFWINDDSDYLATEPSGSNASDGVGNNVIDIPGKPDHIDGVYVRADYQTTPIIDKFTVNGFRDLLDFFPVFLSPASLKNIPDSEIMSGEYRFQVISEGVGLSMLSYPDGFAPGISPEASYTYLRNYLIAEELKNADTISLDAAEENSAWIEHDALKMVKDGRGVILLEGTEVGNGKLKLYLWHGAEKRLLSELPIKISEVEDMFRHVTFYDSEALPNTDIPQIEQRKETRTYEPYGLPDSECSENYVAYMHGFNVDQQSSRGSHSNIFKRLYQSGSRARFIGLSWHGKPISLKIGNYHKAVINAFETSRQLKARLEFAQANGGELTVIGHSLANMVISSAIQTYGFRPDRYFMVDAATPIEAYDADQSSGVERIKMYHPDWLEYDPRLFASYWYMNFEDGVLDELGNPVVGDNRQYLTWRNYFNRVVEYTDVYNFYSPGEEVVKNSLGVVPTLIFDAVWHKGEFAWVQQEMFKGEHFNWPTGWDIPAPLDLVLPDQHGGWGLHTQYAAIAKLYPDGWFMNGGDPNNFVRLSMHQDDIDELGLSEEELQVVLRELPFFLGFESGISDESERFPGYNGSVLLAPLGDPIASAQASHDYTQHKLLAEAIPALSYAVAPNSVDKFDRGADERNFNIEEYRLSNKWPQSRLDGYFHNRNLHSDFKDIAYVYNFPLYLEFVKEGGLSR